MKNKTFKFYLLLFFFFAFQTTFLSSKWHEINTHHRQDNTCTQCQYLAQNQHIHPVDTNFSISVISFVEKLFVKKIQNNSYFEIVQARSRAPPFLL